MREYAFDLAPMPPPPALALAEPEARFSKVIQQARRDSNPQPAVLETAALAVGATGLQLPLLHFFMCGVLVTPPTVLLQLQAVRSVALIFDRGIISSFTIVTGQSNNFLHMRDFRLAYQGSP